MANIASKVTVVHRRDKFRSEKILSNKLIEKSQRGNVDIEWNNYTEEVLVDDVDDKCLPDLSASRTCSGSVCFCLIRPVFAAIEIRLLT